MENLKTSSDSFSKKITMVETQLDELFKEVQHGPAPVNDDNDVDTYKTRAARHKTHMEALEQLKRNFNEWRLRLSQIVEKHEQKYNPPNRDDGDDGDGDPDETPRRRTRERARDRDRAVSYTHLTLPTIGSV